MRISAYLMNLVIIAVMASMTRGTGEWVYMAVAAILVLLSGLDAIADALKGKP